MGLKLLLIMLMFFYTLCAIKVMLIFMLYLCIYSRYLPFHVRVAFLPIPLPFISCCLDSSASSCVCFSLPLCQFRSVILSFQVLRATSGAISSFSTSWPFRKARLTCSASASGATETGRLARWSGLAAVRVRFEGEEGWDGAGAAENDKPGTNRIPENRRNTEISWGRINPHPWIRTFVQPAVLQNSCLLCCHGTDALYCLFVLVSALRNLCYLNY